MQPSIFCRHKQRASTPNPYAVLFVIFGQFQAEGTVLPSKWGGISPPHFVSPSRAHACVAVGGVVFQHPGLKWRRMPCLHPPPRAGIAVGWLKCHSISQTTFSGNIISNYIHKLLTIKQLLNLTMYIYVCCFHGNLATNTLIYLQPVI